MSEAGTAPLYHCWRSMLLRMVSVALAVRQVKRRADAHPQNHDGHGGENKALAFGSIWQFAILLNIDFAEEYALIGPQRVAGGKSNQ